MNHEIKKNLIFDAISTGASATSSSSPTGGVSLSTLGTEGFFSAEVLITGTGVATIGYELSSDGVTFTKPSTQAAIDTALTLGTALDASGGPDNDGKYYFQLTNIPTADFIRFYITETGGAAAVVVTLNFIIQ